MGRLCIAPLVLCACVERPLPLPDVAADVDAASVPDAATPVDAATVVDAARIVDASQVPPPDASFADAAADLGGADAARSTVPYDTCAGPLDVSAGGTFLLDVGDAHGDFPMALVPLGCGGIVGDSCRDVVVTFHLDRPRDVALVGDTRIDGYVSLSLRATCGDTGPAIDVAHGYGAVPLRHRSLPAGTYFLLIGADPPGSIVIGGPPPPNLTTVKLDVTFSDATPTPTNDTCAAPIDLGAGGHFAGSFVDVGDSLMACQFKNPELVYQFQLPQPANVAVAVQSDAYLEFTVRATCGAGTFLDCNEPLGPDGGPRTLAHTYYNLAAGGYFLILDDWGHQEPSFTFDVDIQPATAAPAGDTCDAPIPIQPNIVYSGSLAGMQADVRACTFERRDVVHQVTLAQESDVWLKASGGAFLHVALLSSCDPAGNNAGACADGDLSQAATYVPQVAAGTYYVVVGSEDTDAYQLSLDAWTPAAGAPTAVSGNDTCASAFDVPSGGGVFTGDTTALADDTTPTACSAGKGGHDAVFRWTAATARRVFVTTSGSTFAATVELRDAACAELSCDGRNGAGTGAPAYAPTGALDVMVQPGTYFFVVDGWYASAKGSYRLELRAF